MLYALGRDGAAANERTGDQLDQPHDSYQNERALTATQTLCATTQTRNNGEPGTHGLLVDEGAGVELHEVGLVGPVNPVLGDGVQEA